MAAEPDAWLPLSADTLRRRAMNLDAVAAAGRLVRATLGGVADLVLPPACPVCRARLGSTGGLCADCWQGVRFLERPWCERLGTPLPIDLGPGIRHPIFEQLAVLCIHFTIFVQVSIPDNRKVFFQTS